MSQTPDLTTLGPMPACLWVSYPPLPGTEPVVHRMSIVLRLDHKEPPVFGEVRNGKTLHMGFEFEHPPTADDIVTSLEKFVAAYWRERHGMNGRSG